VDSNRFNQILVLDSIPKGEYNTAKRLFEDLKTHAAAYAPSPAIQYQRVESGDELLGSISSSKKLAKNNDVIPMLHIECHGDEDGFQLADGSLLDWDELKPVITELNLATGLNLMIAVAACTGGALAKTMRMGDRAPFWGLVGPTKSLSARELEVAYRPLYLTLLRTKSPAEAVEAMNAATQPDLFWRTTAQGLFEKVWASYKNEYCNPAALQMRAERMRKRFEKSSTSPPPPVEVFRNLLVSREPAAYERYWKTFFMCDDFPQHDTRFPLNYVA
jgi:hypothetical protein